MKILLLTGVAEEARAIHRRLEARLKMPAAFHSKLRFSRFQLGAHDLYTGITGPGLQKPARLLRRMEALMPAVIINAGLVGVLRMHTKIKPGQLLKIGEVRDHAEAVVYPGGPGSNVLVSVKAPLFQPDAKYSMARQTGADLCDMEAFRLLKLCGKSEELAKGTSIILVKVAGDLPEQASLFAEESSYRAFSKQNRRSRMFQAMAHPARYIQFIKISRLKEQSLRGLANAAEKTLWSLALQNDITTRTHSVFIPHIR